MFEFLREIFLRRIARLPLYRAEPTTFECGDWNEHVRLLNYYIVNLSAVSEFAHCNRYHLRNPRLSQNGGGYAE